MALTRRQKELLDYLKEFITDRGYSPSLEEICQHFGLASKATVHKHLQNLEEKGLIRRDYNISRSIELVEQKEESRRGELPLLGYIAAGLPIEAVSTPDFITVPEHMVARGDCYVLQVKGDSMIDEQIRDGDFVIIEETSGAENGDTVVALVNREDATLKRYYREGKKIRLQPANPKYEPIYVDENDLDIQGKVIGVLRKY
jgi:repressor LexA